MPIKLPQLADVTAFVNPAPISPLFQKGGTFEGWNEDLVLVALFIAVLAILDKIVVAPCICNKVSELPYHPDPRTRLFSH
jgi:hypothetical protein